MFFGLEEARSQLGAITSDLSDEGERYDVKDGKCGGDVPVFDKLNGNKEVGEHEGSGGEEGEGALLGQE